MPAFLIAVVILILLCWKRIGFRAYMLFCLLMTGIGLLCAGYIGKDSFFTTSGLVITGVTLLFYLLSTRRVERSQRVSHMLRLFVYGMFLFVRFILITLIITIPLVSFFHTITDDYHEVLLVDEYGTTVGRTYVNREGKTADGHYTQPYDPY